MCRDATRYKASGAMRSRGEAGKVLRGDAWQSGDRRLRQCRRGRSTRAAQHRREQAVPRTPPQAWGFADVKVATRLGAKSSRVGWCASTVRRVSSPRPCFGCSREENPSATVPTTDTETHLPRSPAGPHLRGSSSHSALTRLSPTASTPPDQNALTWHYALILDWPGRPRTVSTTCATSYRARGRG